MQRGNHGKSCLGVWNNLPGTPENPLFPVLMEKRPGEGLGLAQCWEWGIFPGLCQNLVPLELAGMELLAALSPPGSGFLVRKCSEGAPPGQELGEMAQMLEKQSQDNTRIGHSSFLKVSL